MTIAPTASSKRSSEAQQSIDSVMDRECESSDEKGAPNFAGDETRYKLPEAVVPGDAAGLESWTSPSDDYPEGGRGWWVVAGCSMIASVTIGFQLVWGVFQQYYLAHQFANVSPSVLGLIGSLPPGLMFPVAVVAGKLGDRFGYMRFVIAGCFISFLALLLTSFCKELWQFALAQGVLPALGNGLIMPFVMSYPAQWFKRKRALATGAVIGAASLGGAVGSLIIRAMLTKIGLQHTLLIYSFIHLAVMGTGCLFLKSRSHPGASVAPKRIVWVDMTLLRSPLFWSTALAMLFTCFGYTSPLFYLAEYASDKIPSLSAQSLVVPVAVNNFASAVGRTLIGYLADRLGMMNAFILSVTLSGLSQLLIWNFAFNNGAIIAFAVVFGSVGGCFISLAAPLAASLFGVQNLATLSGMLLFFNTPGMLSGAPLFGAILKASNNNWRAAIIFSGGIQLLGVLAILYARFTKAPHVFAKA